MIWNEVNLRNAGLPAVKIKLLKKTATNVLGHIVLSAKLRVYTQSSGDCEAGCT